MKFTLGTNEFIFEDPSQYPLDEPIEKIQVVDRTASGELKVENFNISIKRRILTFTNMSATDYNGFRNWFDNVCDGAANVFEFSDEFGRVVNVRLTSNIYNLTMTDYNLYQGTVELEMVQ